MSITLSGKEIKDLAEYAGFVVSGYTTSAGTVDEDMLEADFYIGSGHIGVACDDGGVEHYAHVVSCDGCEGNECSPLGDPIK